jgi:hypothetical protein
MIDTRSLAEVARVVEFPEYEKRYRYFPNLEGVSRKVKDPSARGMMSPSDFVPARLTR